MSDPGEWAQRRRRWLNDEDAKVHRCRCCGAWLYAQRPCGTGCPPMVAVARDAA